MRLRCTQYVVTLLTAMLFLNLFITCPYAEDKLVSAKIGILMKSGDQTNRAKSKDYLKTGDMIRIYVHPRLPARVYVIHKSEGSIALLNASIQQGSSATVVLPSIQDFYQVDGKSRTEEFTIICSPYPLKQADSIADGRLDLKQWEKIEEALIEKSRIGMEQSLQKPFPLAGNVRSVGNKDPFIDKLPIYTGKELLIKTYVFEIEN